MEKTLIGKILTAAIATLGLAVSTAHARENEPASWYVVVGHGTSTWGWSVGPLDDYTACERKLGEIAAATDRLTVLQCASTREYPVSGVKPFK